MPELPEVEVTRRGLLSHLLQRRIAAIHWSNKSLRLPLPRKLLRQHLTGRIMTAIDRRAKYLLIRFDNGSVLVIHLGMTGRLGIFSATDARAPHDHLLLELDNGREVRFNDTRRFGSIQIWPPDEADQLEKEFSKTKGIEPLGDDFTAENLLLLAAKRTVAVKTFLMDARIIAGIGNIYANESLFAAGIHPRTRACDLNQQQWKMLVRSCQKILRRAIAAGGSTISDFLGSSGKPGYFQLQLAVYSKKGEPCPQCSATISKENICGRASFFCSHCQPLQSP
jgi:formamidopyrimidine-DNA glycosylase